MIKINIFNLQLYFQWKKQKISIQDRKIKLKEKLNINNTNVNFFDHKLRLK